MSSIELTTYYDIATKYFGTTDWTKMSDKHREHMKSYKASFGELSDLAWDTSLFPYEAQGPFETPLPTPAEIEAAYADKIAKRNKDEFPGRGGTVRIGAYFAKFAESPDLVQEAENLLYLERNSSVRTPKVYAAFASQDTDPYRAEKDLESQASSPTDDKRNPLCFYIIMEYIDGCNLSRACDLCPGLLLQTKIGDLIGEQFRKLRDVPPENPELYGRVEGKPFPILPPFWYPPAPSFDDYGPFDYETLIDRLAHTAILNEAVGFAHYGPMKEVCIRMKMYYEKFRSVLLDDLEVNDRRPVLSHLDFGGGNVMVKLIRDKENKVVDIAEVCLIDWESLCWMPAWYEAAEMIWYESTDPSSWQETIGRRVLDNMGYVSIVPAIFAAYGGQHCGLSLGFP